jgi:uncharacterized membrane protein
MAVAAPPRGRTSRLSWGLVGAAVLVQIVYPLVPASASDAVTVGSVVVFFLASLADVVRVHGPRGGLALVGVAGVGGLVAEAVGLSTGLPFGRYLYTGTLGAEVLGVPLVVPLAWAMMAWPALVVARTLARRAPAVVAMGAAALTAWDVFLDPQMVAAGHWSWANPSPGLPLVPGIPLTNYLGWLMVSAVVMALLHGLLRRDDTPSAPAATLYLWVYFSSMLGHLVFFGLPGSAVTGGLLMGALAVPFALALVHGRRRAHHGSSP